MKTMVRLRVTMRSGESREIEAGSGVTLKQAIIAAGISEVNVLGNCGGSCSCGTCHVNIESDALARLPAPEDGEAELLDFVSDRQPGSRLSCQVAVGDALDGASVRIGPED